MSRVFIGVPTHVGQVSVSTMMSVIGASSAQHDIQISAMGLSLLAKCFNMLFCKAWTSGADYFLLVHSDIGVESRLTSWVDIMVKECDERGAAVLSAIPVIKSQAGHTSTALELEASNAFNMRRLTVRELQTIKSPFNRDNLCDFFGVPKERAGAMLVNTGLMILNLRKFDWTQWPGWGIEDRLVWSKDNQPSAYVSSEDWRMSRWLYEKRWPYFASPTLSIEHVGPVPWSNKGDYGEEHDSCLGQVSPENWMKSE